MTKAEERAMEVYPPRMAYNSMVSVALKEKRDINANNRQIFIQGYGTAEQDLMEKVCKWIEDNFSLYEGISGYHVAKELKQAMKDE